MGVNVRVEAGSVVDVIEGMGGSRLLPAGMDAEIESNPPDGVGV